MVRRDRLIGRFPALPGTARDVLVPSGMKTFTALLVLALAAAVPQAAFAQSTGAPASATPVPDITVKLQQARDAAKGPAFAALAPATRTKVQSIVDQVNGGQLTDLRGAVQQIDAALTPADVKAVLAERAKMVETLHLQDGPAKPDAGRFLLNLSVSREKMQQLHQQETQQPHGT